MTAAPFSASDLEPGRVADIIGVELKSGGFLAARVAVYEGDCTVSTHGGAILFRAGATAGRGAQLMVPSPCNSGFSSL
jgi:hypothetical protein